MTGRYFDESHIESDHVNDINKDDFVKTNNELENEHISDQTESEMTRFIRSSVERTMKYNPDESRSIIKQVMDISYYATSEIPILINRTNNVVRKVIAVGKGGIQTINNLKDSLNAAKKD